MTCERVLSENKDTVDNYLKTETLMSNILKSDKKVVRYFLTEDLVV